MKDFSSPQLLHPSGNIIFLLKTLIKGVRGLIFLLIYFIVKYPDILTSIFFWIGLVVLILIAALYSFVHYRNYKYHIDEEREELVVQQGLVSKKMTVVKFSNIVQVNISQNLIQKALEVYSLTLDTAGSDQVEINLYALSGQDSVSLKELLLHKIGNKEEVLEQQNDLATPSVPTETLLKLSTKNILLFSLLSNYRQGLVLFFAFVITTIQNTTDFFESIGQDDEYDFQNFQFESWRTWLTFIILGIGIIIIIPFIINIARYFITYYNFTIVKNSQGNLSMQYGLVNIKNTIFNKTKVQMIVFKQNLILKKLGIGFLSLRQIVNDAAKADQASVDIPGISIHDKDKVYRLAFEANVYADATEMKPQIGLLFSRIIKSLILCLILFVPIYFIDVSFSKDYLFILLLTLFLLSLIYNYFYFRNYRFFWNGEYLIKKEGVWNAKEFIIPVDRIQSIIVSQGFWQKRRDTGNLYVATSASQVSFRFFDYKQTIAISNCILYKLES